ncbi:hypothetical protein Mal64_26230 [Pseudobythopirellula maris]|uniref:Uncharacterized protein n=1 Tax=Pseudobythopirellula maris TaxID=2527991 RepID=A0A5C5ZI51_9BACT|nr:hypothetical protein [Pseudobythopirellula maris]TWT87089.1 hypothetical protein Mal64_26230 [Pseudobythopirellula maris]
MNDPSASSTPQVPPAQTAGDGWEDCAPGQLAALGGRLRARSARRRWAVQGVGLAACVLLAAGVWGVSTLSAEEPPAARINCRECRKHFEAYEAFLTSKFWEADAKFEKGLARSMDAHLTRCNRCRNRFSDRFPGVLPTTVAMALPLVLYAQRRRRR